MSANDDGPGIGHKTAWGTVEPFETSLDTTCGTCPVEITEENYSGWDVCVGPITFQKQCKTCYEKTETIA